ncbi:hypothetical protein ASF09_11720 [Sphingomonas sp. Leaf242]|nr:hypothetical protein ASF09_11720 [Sphingomonas sp. Leaf242]
MMVSYDQIMCAIIAAPKMKLRTNVCAFVARELHRQRLRGECIRKFMRQHGIDDETEMSDPVNQTLFAVQYPEAR